MERIKCNYRISQVCEKTEDVELEIGKYYDIYIKWFAMGMIRRQGYRHVLLERIVKPDESLTGAEVLKYYGQTYAERYKSSNAYHLTIIRLMFLQDDGSYLVAPIKEGLLPMGFILVEEVK